MKGEIGSAAPADLRLKAHYFCSTGVQFSLGFRSLAMDVIRICGIARSEELALAIALKEARNMAHLEAADTFEDHATANFVIANNSIGVPPSAHSSKFFRFLSIVAFFIGVAFSVTCSQAISCFSLLVVSTGRFQVDVAFLTYTHAVLLNGRKQDATWPHTPCAQ